MWKPLGALILALGVFCGAGAAFAEWKFYKSAEIRGEEKNILKIDHTRKERTRVWFILIKGEKDAFASNPPRYRVDGNPVRDLASAPSRRTNQNADRWIRWTIWDGEGSRPPELLEFIHGRRVVFQYYPSDGLIREATFSLEGAGEAIEEILK